MVNIGCGLYAENYIITENFDEFKKKSFYFSGRLKIKETIVKEDEAVKLLDTLFKQFAIKSLDFNLVRRLAIRVPYEALLTASLLTLEAMLPYLKGRTLATVRKLLNNKEVEEFIQDNLYKYSWLNRAINKRAVSELLEEMKKYGIEFENIRDAYKFAHMSSLYMISVRGETQTDKIIDTVIKIDQKLNKLFSDLTFWTFASIGLKKYEQLDKYLSALMIKNSYADLLPDPIIDKVAFLYAKEREKELKNFEINLTRIWEQLKESAITGELEISLIADYASGKIGELSLALLARASTILALMFPESSLMRIGSRILGVLARSFATKLGVSLYIEWKLDGWLQGKLGELLKYIPPFSDLHIAEEEKVKSDFRLAYNNAFYLVACAEGIDWACKVVDRLGLNEEEIVNLLKPYGDKAIKNLLAWISKLRLKLRARRLHDERNFRKRKDLVEIQNYVRITIPKLINDALYFLNKNPVPENIHELGILFTEIAHEISKRINVGKDFFEKTRDKIKKLPAGTVYKPVDDKNPYLPKYYYRKDLKYNCVDITYYKLLDAENRYSYVKKYPYLIYADVDGIYKKFLIDIGKWGYVAPAGIAFLSYNREDKYRFSYTKRIVLDYFVSANRWAYRYLPSNDPYFFFYGGDTGFTITTRYIYELSKKEKYEEYYKFDDLAKIAVKAFAPFFRIQGVSFSRNRNALIIKTTLGNFVYYICPNTYLYSEYYITLENSFLLNKEFKSEFVINSDYGDCGEHIIHQEFKLPNIYKENNFNYFLEISVSLSVDSDFNITFWITKSEELNDNNLTHQIDLTYYVFLNKDGKKISEYEYFYRSP